MLVYLVSPIPPPHGGIARWTAMLAGLDPSRLGVRLVVIDSAHRRHQSEHTNMTTRILSGLALTVLVCGRLTWRINGERPDVVHLNTSGHMGLLRDFALTLIARTWGVPVIVHLRFGRVPELVHDATWEWHALREVLKRADHVVVLDGSTAEALQAALPQVNVSQIPNFIDTTALPEPDAAPPTAKNAIFVGSLVPSKGVEELLSAWTSLRPEGWRLRLIGPVQESYRRQLELTNSDSSIEMSGPRGHEQVLECLAASDLLILPSYTEGFPNVVLEAMALGRAVLATSVGAVPEMLADDCGVLCKPRDVASLRAALATLTVDPNLCARLGANARQKVLAEYDLDAVVARYRGMWADAAAAAVSAPL